MDERDQRILEILQENGRLSNSDIARILNVSEGTIRKRIEKLLSERVIEKFTIQTKRNSQDAIILIRIDIREATETIERLKNTFPEVYEFSGKADLAIRIKALSIDEINGIVDRIRNIEGVRSTETLIRLK